MSSDFEGFGNVLMEARICGTRVVSTNCEYGPNEIMTGDLAEFLVPVFAKHLTEEELEAAIAFYKTPEGASMLAKMPGLMQDSQQAGALWGEQLGEQIIRALESKGYVSDVSEI